MKKVLFLLVSLLGFVAGANAQTSFKAYTYVPDENDGAKLIVDNSYNVTTTEFVVRAGRKTDSPYAHVAESQLAAKIYFADKLNDVPVYVDSFDVKINVKNDTLFSATIKDNQGFYGLPKTTKTQKTLLVFPEGFFESSEDPDTYNTELTIYLLVGDSAKFEADDIIEEDPFDSKKEITYSGDTIYLERGKNYNGEKEVRLISATRGDEADDVLSVDEKKNGTPATFEYAVEGKKGKYSVDKTTKAKTDEDIYVENIPAGVYSTDNSINKEIPVVFSIADSVVFKPVVVGDSISNKTRHIVFQLTTEAVVRPDDTKYGAGDVDPQYAILTGDDLEDNVNGVKFRITSAKDADGKEIADTWCFDVPEDFHIHAGKDSCENFGFAVEGVFAMNNTLVYSAEDSIKVYQVVMAGLDIDDNDKKCSDLYPVIRDVKVIFPEALLKHKAAEENGSMLNHDIKFAAQPGTYITDHTGQVKEQVDSIKMNANGNYDVYFQRSLKNGNEYLLVIADSTFIGMGADTIMYYNDKVKIRVTCKHILDFFDNVEKELGEKTTTKEQVEVWATSKDEWDEINYIRTYTGKREAICVPFDITVTAEILKNYKFERVTDVSETDNDDPTKDPTLTVWYTTVKEGQKVYANKPYFITALNAGVDTISIEKIQQPKLETNFQKEIKCETTSKVFEFIGTNATKAFTAENYAKYMYFAQNSKTGTLKKLALTNKVSPWRFFAKMSKKDIEYSKIDYAEGFATGINNVNADADNSVMFNVAGQRVSNASKGQIVLKNGKKYITK